MAVASTSSTAAASQPPPVVLGSAYLTSQSSIPPSSPSELGTSICLNLSLFKSTLKRYRALDDAITTRLNRDAALHRADVLDVHEEPQRRTCLRIWADILGRWGVILRPFRRLECKLTNGCASRAESWKRREDVIRHCVATVDDRLQEKHDDLQDARSQMAKNDYDRLDADRREKQVKDELYTEQTRVRAPYPGQDL